MYFPPKWGLVNTHVFPLNIMLFEIYEKNLWLSFQKVEIGFIPAHVLELNDMPTHDIIHLFSTCYTLMSFFERNQRSWRQDLHIGKWDSRSRLLE
jgi:hypothetical protein